MIIHKHLIVALGEIGIEEIAGEKSNPRIDEYLKSVNQRADDEIPWCAAFVNWCLEQASFHGTKMPNARSYLAWGYDISVPRPGAICVYERGQYKWQGHVNLYLDETRSWIYGIGGNQENKVCIRPYRKDKLIQYRWSSEFV